MGDPQIELLLESLDRAFDKTSQEKTSPLEVDPRIRLGFRGRFSENHR
jgi:hypothetical protein